MTSLLAIDPGSNATGLAFFKEGSLQWATTVDAKPMPTLQKKRVQLAEDLRVILCATLNEDFVVVSEEPFLRGPANTSMARFLGALELIFDGDINYIHPSTVKAFFKEREKLDVALAAGAYLKTPKEQNILAFKIEKEDFDATDAIAIGIAWMGKNKWMN